MAPRRNPDIVVAVLCEHGGWGATAAAPLAAQVINAFVTKQRKQDGNLLITDAPKPAASPAPNPNGVPTASVAPANHPGTQKAPAVNHP
jgi:penicillin-binding protein 2